MSERIKEILDELKNEDNYIEDYGFRYKRMALDDVWYLLDYVTNLQDYKSRIEKALSIIEKQKAKMYKSRNKIAMFILMKLEKVLKGVGKE